MIGKIRIGLAALATLLGVAHIIFGFVMSPEIDLNFIWFQGSGVAMIVGALANFKADKIWILRVQNILVLGFICALLTQASEPQIWLGLILFGGLTILSFLKPEVNPS